MSRIPRYTVAALIALAAVLTPAWAAPPSPPPAASTCASCSATLAVTASSARVALPSTIASMNVATIYNAGSKDFYFNFGTVTVTAATTNTRVPSGTAITIVIPTGATYIAAICGGSDTSTLDVTQSNGPIVAR